MIEVISSILEAEEKAKVIVAEGEANAKEILVAARAKADDIRDKAVVRYKATRKSDLDKYEKECEKLYAARVAEGKKQAEAVSDGARKSVDEVADTIVKEIIG